MLTGLKGVKYGLQPGAKQKLKPALQKPLIVFGADDDSGDEAPTVGKDIARQAAKKQADKKVEQLHAAALAEDASVFDYDGVYDSIQQQRVQPKQQEKLARKSRYIEGLLDKAKERQKEQDIIYERQLLKERSAEDHLFGDKDKFVTAAYKKKLEEDQKWLAEERVREARDAKNDVMKTGHMGNFYRNILTNNAAFGTAQPAAEKPSWPSDKPSEAAADPAFEAARRARESYEEAKEHQKQSQAPETSAAAGPAVSAASAGAAVARTGSAAEDGSGGGGYPADNHQPEASRRSHDRDADGRAQGKAKAESKDSNEPGPATEAAASASAAEAQDPVAAAKRAEEERLAKAAAAKQRYLARKRKAPDAA